MCRFHARNYRYRAPPMGPIESPITDRSMRSVISAAIAANAAIALLWALYL